jgi:hypothetical protein
VTGKGNILDSGKHSVRVTTYLVERFLGLDGAHRGEEAMLESMTASARATGAQVAAWTASRPPLAPARAQEVLRRVHGRQQSVGYEGSYAQWIRRVTPPDLA